jgi:hypothetical protein
LCAGFTFRSRIFHFYGDFTIAGEGLQNLFIIYDFTSNSKIFNLYGDVTTVSEGLQNLGLCSALRAFEQGGIFIVPHLLDFGFFRSHPNDRPIQSPLTTHKGV